ncbi:hypothetical protein TrCOL_g11920 [Triparma columacea]|uniref:Uncharacterized protein n=1 Tax=Triparma columacea TaxID=722753 RepID=A0A9W7L3S6_9STRA|nr:hypothetical protein TrCOL_g11920 [Triparma columacea]
MVDTGILPKPGYYVSTHLSPKHVLTFLQGLDGYRMYYESTTGNSCRSWYEDELSRWVKDVGGKTERGWRLKAAVKMQRCVREWGREVSIITDGGGEIDWVMDKGPVGYLTGREDMRDVLKWLGERFGKGRVKEWVEEAWGMVVEGKVEATCGSVLEMREWVGEEGREGLEEEGGGKGREVIIKAAVSKGRWDVYGPLGEPGRDVFVFDLKCPLSGAVMGWMERYHEGGKGGEGGGAVTEWMGRWWDEGGHEGRNEVTGKTTLHYVVEGIISRGGLAGEGVKRWVEEVWRKGGGRGPCKKEYGGWEVADKAGECGLEGVVGDSLGGEGGGERA